MMILSSSIVDHTHTLSSENPGYLPEDTIQLKPLSMFEKNGFVDFTIELSEHFGTHIDAPMHFGGPGYMSVDLIPVNNLIGTAAVIDIRDQVNENPDYELSVSDLESWENQFEKIPESAIVIMYSGWQNRWNTPIEYRNEYNGICHFPGFSADAIKWLLVNRDINGIGVDTLSFDPGCSTDFQSHHILLKSSKWALENLNNLDKIPPLGRVMVVSPIKHRGGSVGPARVYSFQTD